MCLQKPGRSPWGPAPPAAGGRPRQAGGPGRRVQPGTRCPEVGVELWPSRQRGLLPLRMLPICENDLRSTAEASPCTETFPREPVLCAARNVVPGGWASEGAGTGSTCPRTTCLVSHQPTRPVPPSSFRGPEPHRLPLCARPQASGAAPTGRVWLISAQAPGAVGPSRQRPPNGLLILSS